MLLCSCNNLGMFTKPWEKNSFKSFSGLIFLTFLKHSQLGTICVVGQHSLLTMSPSGLNHTEDLDGLCPLASLPEIHEGVAGALSHK